MCDLETKLFSDTGVTTRYLSAESKPSGAVDTPSLPCLQFPVVWFTWGWWSKILPLYPFPKLIYSILQLYLLIAIAFP